MLTKKQKQIYDFINAYSKKHDFAPSQEEMAKHFDLAVSTINQHVEALEKKGYINRQKNQRRSIEIRTVERMISIPLLGTIAAGQPIEATETSDEALVIAESDIGKRGNHYALRVQGNSMIDEGIFDGDIVVIRKQETADNGQTVVAVIDDNEATLKKLYREKGEFRLQPSNPSLFPIYRKEVEIRGVVVKIIRNLNLITNKEQRGNEKYVRKVDYSWDYRGENTKSYTHGIHPYPAMFIPQVARRLLENYSKAGDTVLDIFCGSGTALVESKLTGRNAYGIDLNPFAIFLAKVKTTPLDPQGLIKTYTSIISRTSDIKDHEIRKPDFKNIDFWFKENIILKLSKLKKLVQEIENKPTRDFFMVAFSETVRNSSNTKTNEFKLVRKNAKSLENHNPDVFNVFRRSVEKNIAGMSDFFKDSKKNVWTRAIYGDASRDNGIKTSSIDCIVTSPPYGDSRTTVAYGQFSRLSAQWIDIFDNPNDASGIDNELLGGRPSKTLIHSLESDYLKEVLDNISKKDPDRAGDVLSFYIGLNDSLKQAYKVLKPKKYFCIVIGNRLVKQTRIPTDFIIAELGEKIGFTCEDIIVRNIPDKRMPIRNSPTNIVGASEETMSRESIVILRKD